MTGDKTKLNEEQIERNLVGHVREDGTKRVDRATDFGNPFRLKKDGGNYNRAESVERYEEWLVEKIQNDEQFREEVEALAGEKLGCWCQKLGENGDACHAVVLAKHALFLANSE